jgi:hypothetical protein
MRRRRVGGKGKERGEEVKRKGKKRERNKGRE